MHTTPYHPQSDGLVERFNRILLSVLNTCCQDHPFTLECQLSKVCMAYNTSIQRSTGFTPFYLMFGREARLPVDLMYSSCPDEPQTPITYASLLQESLQQAYTKVRESLHTAHNGEKDHYDQYIHGKPFQPGELVWLHDMSVPLGQSRKLHCPWNGPREIVEKNFQTANIRYVIYMETNESRLCILIL